MARIPGSEARQKRSGELLARYADWLDWNFKQVVLGALWFLFMGFWCAVPVLRTLQRGGGLRTPVVVPGAHDTSFTASLFWVGLLMAVSLLLGIALLVSCLALWRGWLKQPVSR